MQMQSKIINHFFFEFLILCLNCRIKQAINADLVLFKKDYKKNLLITARHIESGIFIAYNEKKINAAGEFYTVCISPCTSY